jgi:large subunit ribosomal protein L18
MNHEKTIGRQRLRRRRRVRRHLRDTIRGVVPRPRLSVFRSNKHMYAQVIDDGAGRTVAAASTAEKDVLAGTKSGSNKTAAVAVGKKIAERSLAAGVKEVTFDRGSYKFHGRVAALAQAAREAGLVF